MYGSDDEDYITKRNSRPLSFLPSSTETYDIGTPSFLSSPPRTPLSRTVSNERVPPQNNDTMFASKANMGVENSPISPPPSLSRKSSSSETAVQQFPLNDIDYESSPAAVAQELSNLQAIRRMSMNVDTADPDLPSFAGVPAAAPSHDDDEDDASRLFWVPARLHPELAPKEFKTFVEDRVDRLKQRSGSGDTLSPTLERSDSGDLRRRKSMLSRQIDSSKGYEDGAERLERKRSEGRNHHPQQVQQQHSQVENLAELENLVNDPSGVIRKISLDSTRTSLDSGSEAPPEGDLPILPPLGSALKRSTRTTYRRGSVRKGDFSKRGVGRRHDREDTASPPPSLTHTAADPVDSLARVQTDPIPHPAESNEAVSQIPASEPTAPATSASSDSLIAHAKNPPEPRGEPQASSEPPRKQPFHSRIASNGRTTAQIPGVPQIIETPPPSEKSAQSSQYMLPERKSSHAPPPAHQPQHQKTSTPPRSSSTSRGGRPPLTAQRVNHAPNSTLDDISSNPSPLPGSGSTRTDALTMVPTFEDKKSEKKKGADRKGSWNWLLGGEEKEREKEKEKHREKDEREKKSKSNSSRSKGADKTRLDVLQSSIDGPSSRGRESLVLDRESIKLEEERKKESTRKSSESSGKKEKDSGILSAIFGGGKRKTSSEEAQKKRYSNRALSPEPPPRILKPDIDYNWTRFSILEERAIYRMAHIKLANPKRALHSQVLLSNFMYSYLAKVQMMHPQMQIPAAQKAAQQKPQKSQERQAEEYAQYQRWQEVSVNCTDRVSGDSDRQ